MWLGRSGPREWGGLRVRKGGEDDGESECEGRGEGEGCIGSRINK